MKKLITAVISCLLSCLLFCSCDPSSVSFTEDMLSDIESVELISYENTERKAFSSRVPDHADKLVDLNTDKITVIYTLDAGKNAEFAESLYKINLLDSYYAYDSPKGVCIRINYKNGNFDILNCDNEAHSNSGYIGSYSENGEVTTFIGCFTEYKDFLNLIFTYFPETDLDTLGLSID